MSKKAMKIALKALRFANDDGHKNEISQEAITALKEALAQSQSDVKQELLFEVDGEMLTLNQIAGVELFNFQEATGCDTAEEFKAKQEQGEPVAYVNGDALDNMLDDRLAFIQRTKSGYRAMPLYTTLQQRTWVGLTDDERNRIMLSYYARTEPLAEAIEAKLKEKNSGP